MTFLIGSIIFEWDALSTLLIRIVFMWIIFVDGKNFFVLSNVVNKYQLYLKS